MAHLDLKVEGMSCEHCVNRVKKAVSKLAGVQTVDVQLEGGKVSVDFDGAQADRQKIAEAIVDAGYEVVA